MLADYLESYELVFGDKPTLLLPCLFFVNLLNLVALPNSLYHFNSFLVALLEPLDQLSSVLDLLLAGFVFISTLKDRL